MLARLTIIPVVIAGVVALAIESRRPNGIARALNLAMASRYLPMACGAFAFSLVWTVWGSLSKIAAGNDEAAYLLQSEIFASGRLVGSGRPLPEFFRQYHVFVEPVLAAKYPPGQALLLTPGVWLGLPGLGPALLVAITAVGLCSVTRRVTDGGTAVLAVFLASTSDIALRFNASYFSETATAAVFVVAWWLLLEYWRVSRRHSLILFAAAVAWGAITRPFTVLAFAVPSGVCALLAVRRHRRWRDIIPAAAVAIPILFILPLWNARVTGDWRIFSQSEYARLFLPSDRLGFGASASPPAAQLSAEERAAELLVHRLHSEYSWNRLPNVAAARAANIVRGTWSYGGLPGLAVLLAVAVLPIGISRVIIVTLLCVFGAYLAYAHDPTWTLYYLELQPPLAFLTAVGLYAGTRWLAGFVERRWPGRAGWGADVRRFAFAGVVIWLAGPTLDRVASYRRAHADAREYREHFRQALAALPPKPSIVFVHYSDGHGEERLVENAPDLSSQRVWIVHDLGAENARLIGLAPNRIAYISHESGRGNGVQFHLERIGTGHQE